MVRLVLVLILLALPAAAQDRDALRLELVLDPRSEAPYAGEMVLATIRGTYRARIAREDLKLRQMTDFDWSRLGQDAWSERRIDGRAVRVMERRIALYPRRAGTLEILPIAHELEVIADDGTREAAIVRSEPVRVEVREPPAGAGDAWLPVRALELSESWTVDPSELEDGQSTERRVVLRALGATPEMLPEQPPLRAPWLITFAPPGTRDLQITAEGPVTTVVWTWTLRPITGEPGVLPEVAIPWFDTGAGEARTAVLPAASIGYASFADNEASGWREGPGVGRIHALFAVAGLLAGLAAVLRGRGASGLRLAQLGRALRRRRDLHRLRRLARRGNLGRFRTLAMRLLADVPTTTPGPPSLLEPVDAILFGPDGQRSRQEHTALMREVRRKITAL